MDVLISFLKVALPLAERGFRVFPLIPKTKRPVAMAGNYDHFDVATTDSEQLRAWAKQVPNANVGLSPDEIFCFLETDDEAALKRACSDISPEVWDTARVSARENRCYYIFRQTMRTKRTGNMTATREGQENLFEFKQHRMYVTGPGSLHPKTGMPYLVEWRTIPAMPDILLDRLRELYGTPKAAKSGVMTEDTKRETALLDQFLASYDVAIVDDWFNKGKQWYRPIECPWASEHENKSGVSSTCVVYTEGGGYGFDCKHRCSSKGWKEFRSELESRYDRKFSFVGATEAAALIGGKVAPDPRQPDDAPKGSVPWRTLFHTKDEVLNCPPPTFLIDQFLARESICAIAAPVAQRKSLIALNVARALCTGEPLFGFLQVKNRPSRVLYLCPEMGLVSLSDRIRKIGVGDCLGDTLFLRSMNLRALELLDIPEAALEGSVLIIDTAIRFLKGDENSSEDMQIFSDTLFTIQRRQGADGAIMALYHSPKATKDASELTLENCLRGSGELGAAITDAHGTRLQQPNTPYESLSFIRHIKCRDYKGLDDFEVSSSESGLLVAAGDPRTTRATLTVRLGGNKANRDGKDDAAEAIIQDNPNLTVPALMSKLKEAGIDRKKTWITHARIKARGSGVKHTSE